MRRAAVWVRGLVLWPCHGWDEPVLPQIPRCGESKQASGRLAHGRAFLGQPHASPWPGQLPCTAPHPWGAQKLRSHLP